MLKITFSWRWEGDPSLGDWLNINEPANQAGNQVFTYQVEANLSSEPRQARIVFSQGDAEWIHEINQAGNPDVQGNTLETASLLDLENPVTTSLDIPGDLDFFRIEVESESHLVLETTGETDTLGTLFDSSGTLLVQNNNGNGLNFRITSRVSPGTYYLRVNQPFGNGTGEYTLTGSLTFIPSLSILSAERTGGETSVSLVFSTRPGQTYRLESSSDLLEWDDVLENPIVAEGTTVEGSYTFDSSTNAKLFLRVRQE